MTSRFLAVALLVASGCSAKLESDISIAGEKFDPAECRSGQAFGFHGIQLQHKDGRRIRMVSNADGTMNVLLFGAGQDVATDVGKCGTLSLAPQNSEINGVKNVEGLATLQCTTDGGEIKGRIKFENCH